MIGNLKQLIGSVYRAMVEVYQVHILYRLQINLKMSIPNSKDRVGSSLTSNCYRNSLSGVLEQYRESKWWWLSIGSEHCYRHQFVNFWQNKVGSNESIERTENWLSVVLRSGERLISGGLDERDRHDRALDTSIPKFGWGFLIALGILMVVEFTDIFGRIMCWWLRDFLRWLGHRQSFKEEV